MGYINSHAEGFNDGEEMHVDIALDYMEYSAFDDGVAPPETLDVNQLDTVTAKVVETARNSLVIGRK